MMGGVRKAGLGIAILAFIAAPIGAGATGHTALAMLAFAGMLLLGNAVMRPEAVRLRDAGGLAMLALTCAAFAALLVGLGQTARALAQIEATLPLFSWVFVSAWALVLARLVWPPRMNTRIAEAGEAALRSVDRAGRTSGQPDRAGRTPGQPDRAASPPPRSEPTERPAENDRSVSEPEQAMPTRPDPALAAGLARLEALPEQDTAPEALRAALTTISGAASPTSVFYALVARARTERDRRALVAHVTDPWVASQRMGKGEPAKAFELVVTAADSASLRDFAALSAALLQEVPAARHDLPSVARLLDIADQIDGDLETEAEMLVTLAHLIEDLQAEAEAEADTDA